MKKLVLWSLLLLLAGCEPKEIAQEPLWLSDVFEYVYAPGQHASLVNAADTAYIIGDPAVHGRWLYLGGFGGYVVGGFPEDIPNIEGPDFEVIALPGAGPEPAVVYVMADENADRLPNDQWYELAGSQLSNSNRSYRLTYYRPESTETNIRWSDNEGRSGELISNFGSLYSSGWWWETIASDSITFTGTRLPDAYENTPVNGTDYWNVPAGRFEWGYAENQQGSDYNADIKSNQLDISNAIDADGQSIRLEKIRFIKVQTAVFQQAGVTNEVSAEIRGARSISAD